MRHRDRGSEHRIVALLGFALRDHEYVKTCHQYVTRHIRNAAAQGITAPLGLLHSYAFKKIGWINPVIALP